MSDWLTIVLSAASAIAATLLTIFLTPRLQHHFWKLQRREELRSAAIREVNRLAAEFITNHMEKPNFRPGLEFFQALQVASAEVRALFSEAGWTAYRDMEIMIGPNLGRHTVDDFIQARDQALRVLYREIGVRHL